MRSLIKKLLIWFSYVFIILLLLFLLRIPIFKAMGHYLVKEETPTKVDAIFVLSGSSYERAKEAAKLYELGYSDRIYTTGGNKSQDLLAYGMEVFDANLTQRALLLEGVDSSAIRTLTAGTSTFEEAQHILGYSMQEGYTNVMVVTSKFHTRRVSNTFKTAFWDRGIVTLVVGATPVNYSMSNWWEAEVALVFVNIEYWKLIYYWFRY